MHLQYDTECLRDAILFANELRERNYTVVTSQQNQRLNDTQPSIYQIQLTNQERNFFYKEKSYNFDSMKELLKLMREIKGGM